MIILSEPQDLSMYICVNEEISSKLHSNGFIPTYKWNGNFYHEKTKKLTEFLKTKENDNERISSNQEPGRSETFAEDGKSYL